MAKKKKFLNILLGVAIGVCLSQVVKQGGDVCEVHSMSQRLDTNDNGKSQSTKEQLLFVGVMTAETYLTSRAKAVYETWGKKVPGKIAFFSSEFSRSHEIPLVPLIGVDDSYPPQKKSFTMLKYMHDHYLDKFQWFMRADDDVYVKTDKLEKLLHSVDSAKPWFIGQTGRGNSEEFGLLSLESDENFCMGGPGIIISRETLRRIGPHLEECLQNLYTNHEDVELGRCVRQQAGVSCTWSYEMQVILYHNQSGEASFTGDLKQKEVHRAITLHPIKQPQYMYRLHKYVKGLGIQAAKQQSIELHRDLAVSMDQLGVPLDRLEDTELLEDVPLFDEPRGSDMYLGNAQVLGKENSLIRFKPANVNEVLDWEFISKSLFSYTDLNPKRRLGSSLKEGLGDVVREVMEIINLYSKQRGRVIDFKEIFYGYWRLDPVHGVDLILDLLLVYRKYRGHKMTVPVRRHAYIQQTFTGIEVREIDVDGVLSNETESTAEYLHQKLIKHVISKIGDIPTIFSTNSSSPNKRINFILPLSGRYEIFKRFLSMYEDLCILEQEDSKLIIILYKTQDSEFNNITDYIAEMKMKHKSSEIIVRVIDEPFSRGKAIQYGVDLLENEDLMLFIDVDIVFNRQSLLRIRQNTLRNRIIYFPIVYSLYSSMLDRNQYNTSSHHTAFAITNFQNDLGAWRQFGFGIVSLYKLDYLKLGGLNVSISGWGFEDVNFYDRAVKAVDLRILRCVDPGLVHVYHPIHCDTNLDSSQMGMCKGSQASTLASVKHLQEFLKRSKHN